MGWLELIPLIRRLLPLLSHVTPLLESVAAGRLGGRADAERANVAVAELANSHTELQTVLDAHGNQLSTVVEELQGLRADHALLQERAVGIERKLAVLAAALRAAAIVLSVLLVACLVLLGVLLTRHA